MDRLNKLKSVILKFLNLVEVSSDEDEEYEEDLDLYSVYKQKIKQDEYSLFLLTTDELDLQAGYFIILKIKGLTEEQFYNVLANIFLKEKEFWRVEAKDKEEFDKLCQELQKLVEIVELKKGKDYDIRPFSSAI